MYRGLYLDNSSGRDLIVDGFHGTDFNELVRDGTVIPSGSTNYHLGNITEPSSSSTDHWGWLHLKTKSEGDRWTKITLFMYVDNEELKQDACYAGFRQGEDARLHDNPARCDSLLASAQQKISTSNKYRDTGDFLFKVLKF
jgi:hypothetical protein